MQVVVVHYSVMVIYHSLCRASKGERRIAKISAVFCKVEND